MMFDTEITLWLPAETEEWADELLETIEGCKTGRDAETDQLVATYLSGGNCNAVEMARMFLDQVEMALIEGMVDPEKMYLMVVQKERQ